MYLFPEDSQTRIVLGIARSTCFVDSMCVFRNLKLLFVGCAEAGDVPLGCSVSGVLYCVIVSGRQLGYLYNHCAHVF